MSETTNTNGQYIYIVMAGPTAGSQWLESAWPTSRQADTRLSTLRKADAFASIGVWVLWLPAAEGRDE